MLSITKYVLCIGIKQKLIKNRYEEGSFNPINWNLAGNKTVDLAAFIAASFEGHVMPRHAAYKDVDCVANRIAVCIPFKDV